MHVRVDETGHDVAAGRVDLLGSLVVAEPGDVPLGDRDVGLEPFAREDREHAAATDDEVRGLVAACDRQPSHQVRHSRRRYPPGYGAIPFAEVQVLTPSSLAEALRL